MTTEELENYEPKGDLIGFPKEIIARMLECQEEQCGNIDVSVFERDITVGEAAKGFNWGQTKENYDFWNEVIRFKNFALFFARYPKKEEIKVCSKCHKEKPVSEFHKRGNTVRPECKECRKQEYQELKTAKYVQVGDNAILSDITSTQSSVEINTTEDNSQEFRIGDKVIDIITRQRGKIFEISTNDDSNLPMYVGFNKGKEAYTLDGRYYVNDKYPRLLHYRDDYDYDVIDFNNLPKRWRAEKGDIYYSFTSNFGVEESTEYNDYLDNEAYDSGNYFQTKEEAQEVADKLNKYFKEILQ